MMPIFPIYPGGCVPNKQNFSHVEHISSSTFKSILCQFIMPVKVGTCIDIIFTVNLCISVPDRYVILTFFWDIIATIYNIADPIMKKEMTRLLILHMP